MSKYIVHIYFGGSVPFEIEAYNEQEAGDGKESQVLGVFSTKEKATAEMKKNWEEDKKNSRFSGYFIHGKLTEEAENDGIELDERSSYIGIWDQYSEFFIEYCIVEHKVQ